MRNVNGYLRTISFFLSFILLFQPVSAKPSHRPTVVLSFDDAARSHYEYVAPLLKKNKFGATFYICEYPGFEDKSLYMTWEQIQAISRMGFEIGNHTKTHKHVNRMKADELKAELAFIEDRCQAYGIPHPTTFAYPGYDYNAMALQVLREKGYVSAREGGERPFRPESDKERLLMPSYTIKGDTQDTYDQVVSILNAADSEAYVIFCFHGVPDLAHDWVSTAPDVFGDIVKYLKKNKYRVISMGEMTRQLDRPSR